MHRFFARLVPVAVLLLAVSGCGSGETPTEPAPPETILETFPTVDPGTLTKNGAFSFPFSVTVPGSMEAVLTQLEPDPNSLVGLALGTWNGSICQIVLAHDNAIQGSRVLANASAVGDYCVRIYDSTGTMARPQTFRIVVAHQ
jgi:hypothetical protein